jgi:tetratricopeptide (TPR) repeat protein
VADSCGVNRSQLSIVLSASGAADEFRASLELLRRARRAVDQIVCVVPDDRPDLRAEVDGKTWLTVVDDGSGEQAGRWSAGIAAAEHAELVLLDGDVLLPPNWLDPILEALRDPGVVAVGPRCHLSSGPQGVDVPEPALRSAGAFKAFARGWRHQHRGHVSEVDRLGPVCVALRREALERAGGPAFDLPYDRLREQGRIVLVHESLLGHADSPKCTLRSFPGGVRPLISGTLIVRDEEDVLGVCLTALQEFVDELVVYDTGSGDRTREVARERGARVVEGYWDDHFGDARNRALAHCAGEWVLAVDADEIVTGDAAAVRGRLMEASEHAFLVSLESQRDRATVQTLYPRLFRRDRARYVHRVHEQVVDRVTGQVFAGRGRLDQLLIVHSGQTADRLARRDQRARNLRLAALSVDDRDANAVTHLDQARSWLAAGAHLAALDACEQALRAQPGQRVRVLVQKCVIDAYLAMGRLREADAAVAELRRISISPVAADEREARVRFAQRRYADALALVRAFPEAATDDAFTVVERTDLADVEIRCLFHLDRPNDAAASLRESLRAGRVPVSLPEVAELLAADGSTLAEVAALVPLESVRGVLFSAQEAPAELADELLEALWSRPGAQAPVLAFAAQIGGRLPVIRALEWSARLRSCELDRHCTLRTLAVDVRRTPRERTLAAAVALEMFADIEAMAPLVEALAAVPDDDTDVVLAELAVLAPAVAAAVEPEPVSR